MAPSRRKAPAASTAPLDDLETRRIPYAAWFPVLVVLECARRPVSSSEVARRVLLATKGNTGGHLVHVLATLDRLQRDGLVDETTDDGNTRNPRLWRITDAGRATGDAARALLTSLIARRASS